MGLFESGEDYLEAILMVSERKNEVHAIDVVNELGYSKPSVSIALKKLKEQEYITIDEFNHLHLTKKGLDIAKKIYERHKILTSILEKLGVDANNAEKDACKLEHDLSDVSWNAIKKYYYDNLDK
ncbi:DtxR family iron (metal) dependent repressor [Anaeroplasma bactoclasticum]|uniref:DtxR family iron (Metal) dependent repressor n=1 Tax=Anaeroplasma bactoclasticum TaxID=2088 RepID=A0A397QVH2_9MOLU|nr:metal-dependent transcriptional regulator [Anaeroplasma bactoclasticum]RIA65042.1 DtxR family iron (metal) dependent repressor [Anaeroplasma bactoclasticum]